jgi:hypothetical protein
MIANAQLCRDGMSVGRSLTCDEIWLVLCFLALPSWRFDMDVLDGQRLVSPFDHVVVFDAVGKRHGVLVS